ncbi:hypothetical protein D3C80_109970 [compost metagenome]
MGGLELADGRHVAYAVDQGHHRFTDALLHHLFADDLTVRQREQHRGPQRIDVHAQCGENFYHLHAAP